MRRFLDLQEQRVVLVATLQQDDERACPDAADADDLARGVDDFEPLEQVPPVVLQGAPIGAELLVDPHLHLFGGTADPRRQIAQRHHDRRLTDDSVLAVDELRELRQRLQAVARVRLPSDLLGALFGRFADPDLCVRSCRRESHP